MLDEIFDLFERDKKRDAPKQGGVRGLLSRFGDHDDRYDDDRKRRYDDDDDRRDDDRDYRGDYQKPRKKRREFELFGDD